MTRSDRIGWSWVKYAFTFVHCFAAETARCMINVRFLALINNSYITLLICMYDTPYNITGVIPNLYWVQCASRKDAWNDKSIWQIDGAHTLERPFRTLICIYTLWSKNICHDFPLYSILFLYLPIGFHSVTDAEAGIHSLTWPDVFTLININTSWDRKRRRKWVSEWVRFRQFSFSWMNEWSVGTFDAWCMQHGSDDDAGLTHNHRIC